MGELGFVLHDLRRRRGLTQRELAQKAGTTPEYISQLETGVKDNPSLRVVMKLALALGTTVDPVLIKAGMLPEAGSRPLAPEVEDIDAIIRSYPQGPQKEMLKLILKAVGAAALGLIEADGTDADVRNQRTKKGGATQLP